VNESANLRKIDAGHRSPDVSGSIRYAGKTRCILRARDASSSAPLELQDAWHRLPRIDRLKCLKRAGKSDPYATLFPQNLEFNAEVFDRLLFSQKEKFLEECRGFLGHRVHEIRRRSFLKKITVEEQWKNALRRIIFFPTPLSTLYLHRDIRA